MILERLKKAKEYHDGIQRIPTALDTFCVSITEEKQHIKGKNKMLKDIQNNTMSICEHIQKTCKEK